MWLLICLGNRILLCMFIILVSGSVFATETRLVIGDNGFTVVEKIFEQEFTTATEEISLSPDTLPLQTVPESVTLQEVSDSPRTKIHSYKFYKKAVTLEPKQVWNQVFMARIT